MRLLYFSPRDCWPTTSGARLRDYYLARGISRRGKVTYLGFSKATDGKIWRGRVGRDQELDCVLVPSPPSFSPANLVRGLTGPLPITLLNFVSTAMRAELEKMLRAESFDLVQMEGVHLYPYLAAIRGVPGKPLVVADWHNIESELMRRYAENLAPLSPQRWYAARTASLVAECELRLLDQCDAHLVCSGRERQALLQRSPGARIRVTENGVDTETFQPRPASLTSKGRDLVFVGSMDYHANIDAAKYFANQVWPQLRARRPDLRLVLVGSRPVAEIVALGNEPGIVVTGTVESIAPYYEAALAAIVPLRVGSGTRLKVLEAMAAGVPVISTKLGAEGLDVESGKDLLLADTPDEFMAAVERISSNPAEWDRLATAGRRVAEGIYDWSRIGDSLGEFYEELLSAPKR